MKRKMPKYRKMTDDEMKNAIDLVLSGGSAYKASKKYGIPSNTLKVSHETHERGYMSAWVVHCNVLYLWQCMTGYKETQPVGFTIIYSFCSYWANECY